MGHNFYIYFNEEELKTLIANAGTDLQADVKKFIKAKSLETPNQTPVTDIDSETKQWKLRKLKAETQIKEHELLHINTFDASPSPEAKAAIQKRFEGDKSPKQIDTTTHTKLYQDRLKGWHCQCNHCEFFTANPRDLPSEALTDMVSTKHLERHVEVFA